MKPTRKWRIALLINLLVISASLGMSGKRKTSEIPERREFPVNPKISPCQDFFQYACSEAIDGFELREDRSKHIFSFSDSSERLLEAKKKFLATLADKKGLSPRSQALANVYTACMNEKAAAAEEKELVAGISQQVLSIKSNEEFQKFLSDRVDSGDYSFIDFGTIGNLDDSDWNDIYLVADLQSLPERTYYDKPEVTGDLEGLAKDFFQTIGLDKPAERAKSVVDFEKQFTKTYPTPSEFRDLINTKTGIDRDKLVKQYPSFRLSRFLDRIPKRTHLRHLTPKNFEFVNETLQKASLETLKNVYLFHSLPAFMDDAYPEFYKKEFEFRKKHLGGPNSRPVRQERCTTYVMDHFTKEIDAELLPVLFASFPEEKFVQLVEKVRSGILKGIENNNWLSPKSKKEAEHKIRVAGLQLIKPRTDAEWDFNPPAEYARGKYYANRKLLDKNLSDKEIRELAEKRDRSRWEMGPLTVNAYYSPSDNKFVMPIGILQYPFYDPKLPETTNLGAVGMVVGHELGHAIDDHGAKYDYRGRMIQWMAKKDLKEFERRGAKMVAQFDKAGLNGKLTLGENIGDLVGLTFAYQAAFPEGKGDIKDKQAFFLQEARAWCGVVRPKMRELLAKTDPHASMEARVNEQVKHQPGFEEAFQCKPGDPMVLSEKDRVKIW